MAMCPCDAFAEPINIMTVPQLGFTGIAYDTSANLDDAEDSFRTDLIAALKLNPQYTGSNDTDKVLPLDRNNVTTYSNHSGTTSTNLTQEYAYQSVETDYWITNRRIDEYITAGKVLGETDNLCYLAVDMYETPLAANSRLTFDGFQGYWNYTYIAGSLGYHSNWTTQLNANTTQRFAADNVSVWASTTRFGGNAVRCPYVNGYYNVPIEARYLFIAFRMRITAPLSVPTDGSHLYMYYSGPLALYWQILDYDTTHQTDDLKDTTGSDTITSDPMDDAEQIVEGMDFVQQTGSFITASYDTFANASPDSSVPFPGLNIMGHQIIPASNVSVLGYLGTDIENHIRDGVTLVVFLAWIMGLRSMYHRIFLGEIEVDVIEE